MNNTQEGSVLRTLRGFISVTVSAVVLAGNMKRFKTRKDAL